MKDLDIIVIGDINIDLILQDMQSLPEYGKEKIARTRAYSVYRISEIQKFRVAKTALLAEYGL